MRKILFFSILFLWTCSEGPTEPETNSFEEKTFGTSGVEAAYSVEETFDGGYILAGTTSTYGFLDNDMYLVKTDMVGNEIWSKSFSGIEAGSTPIESIYSVDKAYSVKQTSDGGYILGGYKQEGDTIYEMYLVKTDVSGNEMWNKKFSSSSNVGNSSSKAFSVEKTSDGGYILGGHSDDYRMYLVKTDSSGNEIWNKKISGGSTILSLQQTSDGGYVLAGVGLSPYTDMYLVKTDASGNEMWSQTLSGGGGFGEHFSIEENSDGGYIFVGSIKSPNSFEPHDMYLVKLDASGNEMWSKTFGESTMDEKAYSGTETTDGGYILAGTKSNNDTDRDMYVVKTDASGNEMWSKTFGGNSDDRAFSIKGTSDGGYILAGYTYSFGAGHSDMYLVKINSKGNRIF